MPDPASPVAPAPTPKLAPAMSDDHHPKPRGYFNQAQLDDLETADGVLAAAQEHADDLAGRAITAEYLSGFSAAIATATGQATDAGEAATLSAGGAERALVVALQGIQSAAKQKHRMLAEDDDAATNFSTEGYLIGQRLNANRPALLQDAAALLAKAAADALPGYDPAGLAAVTAALEVYQTVATVQQTDEEDRGLDKGQRDTLIRKINSRRMATQHAADAMWPYTAKSTPIRKAFHLPQSRPFNG